MINDEKYEKNLEIIIPQLLKDCEVTKALVSNSIITDPIQLFRTILKNQYIIMQGMAVQFDKLLSDSKDKRKTLNDILDAKETNG